MSERVSEWMSVCVSVCVSWLAEVEREKVIQQDKQLDERS